MSRKGEPSGVAWGAAAAGNDAEVDERVGSGETAHPPSGESSALGEAGRPSGSQRRSDGRRGVRRAQRRGMASIPVAAAAKKLWIVLVIVVVIAVAGFCVHRLRGVFGVHDNRSISNGVADDIKPFNPKHVVYEVYGPPGTVANINYLDITAQPRRVDNVPLPWTLSVTTTLPSVSVNVVAQGNSDQIGCRITVNDVVKDERSSNGVNAQTFCIVKSA